MTQRTNNEAKENNEETNISDETSSNVLDFSATLKELSKNVDPNLVRQRPGRRDQDGNLHTVDYVEWHTVADILDEHAPNWGHTVKDIRQIGEIITVVVAITIDGVTREGVGTGNTASETGIKKAEHDALKRAAVKFGIARELYKKEFEAIDHDEQPRASFQAAAAPANSSPMARSLGDMVTAKQLGMIRALARVAGIDPDQECESLMNCSVDELSKRAASDFIDRLQELQRNVTPIRRAS